LKYSLKGAKNWQGESSTLASPALSALTPHFVVFVACFCILAGAIILSPAGSETNHLELGSISLPHVCMFRSLTGLPCPGCGLSRSIVAAMDGDLGLSLAYHRLGLLTLVYICLQFIYRLGLIVVPKWRARFFPYGKFLNRGIIVLAVLFMLNWILTLILMVSSIP
jgi:hypothetical protein